MFSKVYQTELKFKDALVLEVANGEHHARVRVGRAVTRRGIARQRVPAARARREGVEEVVICARVRLGLAGATVSVFPSAALANVSRERSDCFSSDWNGRPALRAPHILYRCW